jgi:hypothetical protein
VEDGPGGVDPGRAPPVGEGVGARVDSDVGGA